MSRVRTGHKPGDWSDNEPDCVGRISFTRYGLRYGGPSVVGGTMVVGRKPIPLPVPATTPARRAQMAESKARRKAGELCGRLLPSKAPCARVLGHGWECRTGAAMARMAAAKRTGGVVR